MDRLDRMKLFARIVERRSFSAAARDHGLARSTATEAMKSLERDLGARLLERTTRHVTPTLDGEAYYRRCIAILAEIEEAEADLGSAEPHGLLRVDAHGVLTRTLILPRLPEFTERYPRVDLHFGQGDRLVDLVREGVDCVIRAGNLDDSGMIARRLAMIPEITCASPEYLASHGMPAHLRDLDGHQMVGFVSSRTGGVLPLEFTLSGRLQEVRLPHRVTANDAATVAELACLGYGLVQAPRYRFAEDLRRGRLVEVLPDCSPSPLPLTALYAQNRHLSLRLRVFLDWVSRVFAEARF